ncbi:DUF3379 family protein [Alteromonas sp. a30]|uniref:DUF3379 family protein n=1 Tax=Alteromonas sp. a30 TaxID=2730917 RepID=UPI00227F0C2A|nr:DUF3379 family protein [Alteromonas sp. a30]MCY7295875.1 DUF3379 domain-containing protein [Alteromonas sp. a30]
MDDLEFRRKLYAEPYTSDEAILGAAADDPSKQQFIDELKQLENRIQSTVHAVPVPDGLAHKLIFRQSIESHSKKQRRGRFHLALAASIAFVAGLTLTMVNQQPEKSDFAAIALGHIHHEQEYTNSANEHVDLNDVNAKLASFGGEIKDDFSHIYFANYCLFEKQKSLHLVVGGEGDDRYTVFIMPRGENEDFVPSFEDENFVGKAWQTKDANVVVISEKTHPYEKGMEKVKENLVFSI